jgi:tRNA A-37 threonylcarbamoyl transferase component Bud32
MVIIEKDRVIKTGISRKEILLTKVAHGISKNYDWFYVPQIIDFDGKEIAVLELIDNILPLRDILFKQSNDEEKTIINVGKALAVLHKELIIVDQKYFIHGDFNIINVAYQLTSGRIIIFDWCLNPSLSNEKQYTEILDIASFLRAILLQNKNIIKSSKLWKKRALQFMTAYQLESNKVIKYKELIKLMRHLQRRSIGTAPLRLDRLG